MYHTRCYLDVESDDVVKGLTEMLLIGVYKHKECN